MGLLLNLENKKSSKFQKWLNKKNRRRDFFVSFFLAFDFILTSILFYSLQKTFIFFHMYETTQTALENGHFWGQALGLLILILIFIFLVLLIYLQIRVVNDDLIGKWLDKIKKELKK